MAKLKLDYVDLYLIHWMLPKHEPAQEGQPLTLHGTPLHKVWPQMEALVDAGLAKSIGVSNCTIVMLLDLFTYARIKPAMNQIELHPYLSQSDAVAFNKKLGVAVTGYSPLGASGFAHKAAGLKELNLHKEELLVAIGAKYGKSPAQVALNWHVKHRGHIVIPKTAKVERLSENLRVYDFELTKEEYEKIDELNCNARFFNPKNWASYLNAPLFE